MRSNFRQAIILIGCLFLCACHGKGDLQVVSRNFETEVEQQQNLEFTFSKDLVTDSMLNAWDSTAYIEFSPAVKGQFKWNNTNELIFSPAEGFLPGTSYTAKLTRLLLKRSKKQYSIDGAPITFGTAPLRVTATHLSWTRGKNVSNVMVQMDMSFNYDVNLGEAAKRLKLSSGGNAVSVGEANNGTGKVLSVQFMPLNNKDEETPLKIELGKGISVPGTKYTSVADTTISAVIPSRYTLAITSATGQHTGNDGIVTVTTSQPVVENNLKNIITITPAVPFEVATNEGGFTITSNQMSSSVTYQLTVSTALEGIFGGRMKKEFSEQITFGKLKPSITFISEKGMYLSAAGARNLAVNIVNVPVVEVTVIKVFENNLEQFMRRGKTSSYGSDPSSGNSDGEEGNDNNPDGEDNNRDGDYYHYYETNNLGDVAWSGTYTTANLPKQNSASILKLDFADKLKDYNGVYVIKVASKDHNWIQESKIVSVSDIGLIVKEENDGMYVFANSIRNATPLSGVAITFVGTNNQKMYTANTDGEGAVVFKNISAKSSFTVGMITAKMGEEFSFVSLSDARIGTSRFDVGGRRPNGAGLNAMLYGERNLYRPGETIHLSAIVRDEKWNPQPDVPVKIKLVMPNGKEFATVRKTLNEQGSCDVAFTPPPTAMTGSYTASVYTGNDVLLNSLDISVEEFMPDRMKVSLKLDKEEYRLGESVTATVQADNLFGTPAAERNYQCELNLEKVAFSSDKFDDYSFSLNSDFRFNTDLRDGKKTNDKGTASEAFAITPDMAPAGVLKGSIMATVFDETGRPVHRYGHFTVYTQPLYAGIKCNDYYVTTKAPVHMGLVALDKAGTPQSTDAQVVLIKREWHTVIQQNGNSYRYVSQPEERVISTQKVHIAGSNTDYVVVPQQSGTYEVRVFLNGSNNYVSRTLYSYGWNDTQYTSFDVDNEGNVEIKADKKEYNTGDNVNVLLTTPFDGRMLVTLERGDQLIKYYYVTAKNKSASISFKADDAMLPNVYVTATLFRPMDGSDMPLTVAHGFKSVKVENKSNILPVEVSVAEKSRSKVTQTINVKTAPGAFVTIAAVDEGILQVKNYETPDPYEFFYQKVALAVNSYDIYPWLLPEIKTTVSSTGGDGAGQSSMRVNATFVNRVKNVTFWSGILQADGSGNVRYNIDIPQFSGDLRVMALAYKGRAFGSADKHMKVADPIVISTALPRFLSPKDEVVMPVSMSNTTNKDASATVTIKVSGPLAVKGEETQTVQIPANREGRAVFNVTASPAIGACKVTVTVKALGETFVNETEIGVRPPASLQKVTGSGLAAENSTTPMDLKTNFIPSSVSGKLVVGKSPLTQFSKNLDDLVRYPYGCVEQTTSSAFPQLYYADIVKSMNGTTNKELNPAYNVQQAILKLQSMQQGDGGLSYWPQGGEESWWGSIYAAHFLIEAKKAGYEVNAHTLYKLEQYMTSKLENKETMTFFYNGHMKKQVVNEEVPYSLYVLAMAGKSQPSTMNYYKAHQDLLTLDGKYLLAAAYSLSGQPAQARQVLPPAFSGEEANRCFGGSFYSFIRDQALSLDVLMDIDPNNRQVGVMALELTRMLKKERYLSTQENAFSMLALGKVARLVNKTTSTASVSAAGRNIGNTTGQSLTINMKPYANDPVSVSVKGNGGYYYFWEVDGITSDGSYRDEDNLMQVRRTFLNREGHEISNNTFRQNDLVVVHISIVTQYEGSIDNVAITDMLPAGFEIENTRLTEMPHMDWVKDEDEPDYRDIRDDRINMFTTVSRTRKDFYYMVRAVSPGTYQLGPVQADAMYDGNYHSYHGAGVVKIMER